MKPATASSVIGVMGLVQRLLDFAGRTSFEPDVEPLAAAVVDGLHRRQYDPALHAAAETLAILSARYTPAELSKHN
ncbi:hypothetical protein [Gemmata sp.]|uniref:hypothetical protein n=1 Tax=Gemmata sp. TaxID=1914242 RepID=UPI003F6EBF38